MFSTKIILKWIKSASVVASVITLFAAPSTLAQVIASPNLVFSYKELPEMRAAIASKGRYAQAYKQTKSNVDKQLALPIVVPVPADGGGGYTHERHKNNYQTMYKAGIVYNLSGDKKYADFVRNMLLEYAVLYPTLDVHPKRKVKAQNPGKLFWQSLNEAVWLVHTIQAYDLVREAISVADQSKIEQNLLKPVAIFLSEGQPSTFNKVHNHGTWATAGVGMAGFVLNEPEWVEKALYDLDKSGKGGFFRQLDELFSPQGYYNEGPYYQRYALMPFVTFAKAIENNQPERKIFEYRDGILLKAITTTIELNYNGLFFPINDAIKSKGIDTIELVHGVAIAFGLTGDTGLLDIANQQQQIILMGDGLKVAQALDAGLATPYQYQSMALGDGASGTEGALVVMRQESQGEQALVFKPAAQGLGHGHFDKLTWQFYDKGNEIVSDYGAARFLNVEAKYGGRYLPENNSYAKQTIAHNTLVVDEKSHFDGQTKVGNQHHPELLFFETNQLGSISSAKIDTAYADVELKRTMALVTLPDTDNTFVFDIFKVNSENTHQYDLPVHYQGQLIETNFERGAFTQQISALGKSSGYQHLWLTAQTTPDNGLSQVTWLNDNGRFYTQTAIVDGNTEALFTRIGANDPQFNLRNETAFIYRKKAAKAHTFVSVLEPHGQYNPSKEFTVAAKSTIAAIEYSIQGDIELLEISLVTDQRYLFAFNHTVENKQNNTFTYQKNNFSFNGRFTLFELSNK